MTDPREQLESLLSRQGDGDLTTAERAEIRRAVERDPSVAAELKRYEKLGALLASWRPVPANVDWASFRQGVSESIESNELASVDAAVKGALGPMPAVDWNAFRTRVSSAVRAEARGAAARGHGSSDLSGMAKWLVPFAAAAAIAIAFFRSGGGPLPVTPPNSGDQPTIVLVSLDIPEANGRVSIAFDETPAPEPEDKPANGLAYMKGVPAGGYLAGDDDGLFY